MRNRIPFLLGLTLATGVSCEAPAARLEFSLDPQVRWLSPTLVEVPYTLTNPGRQSVHVAQIPGPSLLATCSTPTSGRGGSPEGGWSSEDGGLRARELFVQLAPGEALRGKAVVEVSLECTADVVILGVYQAAKGSVAGEPSATGRFRAEDLHLALPVALRGRPAAEEEDRRTLAAELTALYNQDQADRAIGPAQLNRLVPRVVESLMRVVDIRDATRRARVRKLMAAGAARTADDYYHAAVVLQHGSTAGDYLEAHEWVEAALALRPEHGDARYLFAASWDRYQLSQGKPQWFGTSVERGPDGKGMLSSIDSTRVTDSLRNYFTGWILAERRAFVERMNKQTP